MDAKERARRFKEHQELVSKVGKQQEDIKKKHRQKRTGEEAFDEIFKGKDLFEHIYFNDEEKENFPVDLYNSVNDIFQ